MKLGAHGEEGACPYLTPIFGVLRITDFAIIGPEVSERHPFDIVIYPRLQKQANFHQPLRLDDCGFGSLKKLLYGFGHSSINLTWVNPVP